MKKKKVVIIGGVAGGASAAARLRRLSEEAEIILFERGSYISFANCGLLYYVGGEIEERERLFVQTPEGMTERFNVQVRTEHEVLEIRPKDKTLVVKSLKTGRKKNESYDKLIISPGAYAFKPKIPGIDHDRVFTIRNMNDTDAFKRFVDERQPKKAVILGGGPIGLEAAENLKRKGIEVSVVELSDHLYGPLDLEMAAILHQHLKQKGIDIRLKSEVVEIEHHPAASVVVTKEGMRLDADIVVLGIGARPEVVLAHKAGLKIGELGGIEVNEYLQTSNPHIYAVGDAVEVKEFVSGKKALIALAGPANKQGRIAAGNVLGGMEKYQGSQGSNITKVFDLTLATTGLGERLLERFKIPYESVITHTFSHAGYYPGAMPLTLKLLFSPSGKILGAQGVGFDGVDKRIDVIATAIRGGLGLKGLEEIDLCYAPPYSSAKDPVNILGYMAGNVKRGLVKTFYYKELDGLDLGKTILLDVRTRVEHELGTIEGAVNIPLDELRQNLDRLSKKKTVHVFCEVGLRGYLACRILAQAGFRCKNLSGGYKTYSLTNNKEGSVSNHGADVVIETQSSTDGKNKDGCTPDPKLKVNACGLSCPGPLQKVNDNATKLKEGEVMVVDATDPAFTNDVSVWCQRTGNKLLSLDNKDGIIKARIQKGDADHALQIDHAGGHGKTLVVFSDDIDKVIATFIIANGAASMNRQVTMFFTFWGLNVLRKSGSAHIKKDIISKAFGWMMPKGSTHLKLSQMNMGGAGTQLIRYLMKKKHIGTLEELIQQARDAGVRMVACSTSMEIMGIKAEELIDGVEIGGVATFLGAAEEADTNLFV